MTDDEKIELVDMIEDLKVLNNNHFEILKQFSYDNCSFLRSRCAALLVNFINEDSMNLLIKLCQDEDSFVRTEAYDTLGVFWFGQSEEILFRAIQKENDDLALSYAILSWADVVKHLHDNFKNQIAFVISLINQKYSEDVLLSCYYALYTFGNQQALERMIEFLNNKSYHVRCSTLNLLHDVSNSTNVNLIEESINKLLKTEKEIAVRSLAIEIRQKIEML